jgi:hypothetical protein
MEGRYPFAPPPPHPAPFTVFLCWWWFSLGCKAAKDPVCLVVCLINTLGSANSCHLHAIHAPALAHPANQRIFKRILANQSTFWRISANQITFRRISDNQSTFWRISANQSTFWRIFSQPEHILENFSQPEHILENFSQPEHILEDFSQQRTFWRV